MTGTNGQSDGGHRGADWATRTRRSDANTMLDQMDEAGARQIPLSDKLLDQIEGTIRDLMNSSSPRLRATGVRLAMAAAKYNRERFAVANGQQINVTGNLEQEVTLTVTMDPPRRLLDLEK